MATEAPLTYEVTGRSDGRGTAEIVSQGTPIVVDSSPARGLDHPGPAELLAGAFAACMLKNVERFGALLPFRHEGGWVHVRVERQATPPRFRAVTYALHVRTDEPSSRLDLLHLNLRRHGTVFNTLAAVCEVTGHIIGEPLEPEGPASRA